MRNHPLIQKVNEFCSLPDDVVPQLLNAFKISNFSKEKTILREGFANRNIYFLHTGVVRRYYISRLGHQKTTAFFADSTFFTDLESFERRKASGTTFNTEKDCTVYSLDYIKFQDLIERYPAVREAFTKMREYYFNLALQRQHFLATEPVESRVKMLIKELPCVVEACRKRDIISYLRTNSQTYNFILKNLPPSSN